MYLAAPTRHLPAVSRLLIALLLLAVVPGAAVAAPKAELTTQTNAVETPAVTPIAQFYAAVEKLDQGDFGAAAKGLEGLKARAALANYQNLTELSFQLVARAERAKIAGKDEEASFLARWAESLSPTDARIQLALAKFPAAFEGRGFFSRAIGAMKLLPSHPYLSSALLCTLLLVVLVAGTLGMLLVSVIQLLRHGDSIVEGLGKLFPYAWRGFGAIGLMLVLLTVPLAGGLLCALACWGLLLTRYVTACRRFSLNAGILILTWGLAIPVLAAARLTLGSDLLRAMEEIHNDAYVPRAEMVLHDPIRAGGREPVVSFLLGVSRYREGDLKGAQTNFTQAVEASSGGALRRAAQVNLGAAMLALGDVKGGRDALVRAEEEGVTSFELYYNLSQAQLLLLDTEAARRYSQLALAADRERLARLEQSTGENQAHRPLLSHAPTSTLLPQLLRTTLVGAAPAAELQRSDSRTARLVGLLLIAGKTETIVLLGLLSIALGWYVTHRAKHAAGEREPRVVQEGAPSLVWYLLPGGGFVAAERPMIGATVLTAVIACVLLAFGSPVRPLPGIPPASASVTALLCGAATIFLFGAIGAAVMQRLKREV